MRSIEDVVRRLRGAQPQPMSEALDRDGEEPDRLGHQWSVSLMIDPVDAVG